MKTQIRKSVFETNSSSTHTLTVVDTKDWNDFKEGRLLYDSYEGYFLTREDLKSKWEKCCQEYSYSDFEQESEEAMNEWRHDECIYTWDEYLEMYEVLEEEIEEVNKTAVSIYGYE